MKHQPPPPPQPPQPMPVQSIQQNTSVSVRVSRPFNHLLHLTLTVVTCGAWLPIWVLCRLFYRG